jgi:hypothetical protein
MERQTNVNEECGLDKLPVDEQDKLLFASAFPEITELDNEPTFTRDMMRSSMCAFQKLNYTIF